MYMYIHIRTKTHIYVYIYIHIYKHIYIYIYIYIRHRAVGRVRGNEASRPRDTFYLLFGVLPNFTDLIQVSTYLEDCFVLLIQVLGAPTPSARVNITTLA